MSEQAVIPFTRNAEPLRPITHEMTGCLIWTRCEDQQYHYGTTLNLCSVRIQTPEDNSMHHSLIVTFVNYSALMFHHILQREVSANIAIGRKLLGGYRAWEPRALFFSHFSLCTTVNFSLSDTTLPDSSFLSFLPYNLLAVERGLSS